MNELVIQSMEDLGRISKMFIESGFFKDVKSVQAAGVLILAGKELNLGPMESIKGLHIIQGKVEMSAMLMSKLVKRTTKYNYRITEATDIECKLEWFESGESVGHSSYTMEEAKTAGLAYKDNWKKNPSDMLFARALTRGARRFAPDAIGGGTYVDGEIDEPINVTPQPEPAAKVELDPIREKTIINIKGYIRAMNDDERQDVKNQYMVETGKDFPESNWQGLKTDQLQLLEVMLAKKADGDNTGYKVISDAFESLDPTAREQIATMFSDKFGDWIDIDQQTQEQLAQMEGWLNIEVQK